MKVNRRNNNKKEKKRIVAPQPHLNSKPFIHDRLIFSGLLSRFRAFQVTNDTTSIPLQLHLISFACTIRRPCCYLISVSIVTHITFNRSFFFFVRFVSSFLLCFTSAPYHPHPYNLHFFGHSVQSSLIVSMCLLSFSFSSAFYDYLSSLSLKAIAGGACTTFFYLSRLFTTLRAVFHAVLAP